MSNLQTAFAGLDMSKAKTQKETTKAATPSQAGRFLDFYTDSAGKIGKAAGTCAETIGTPKHGETMHVVSMGDWSAEHVIAHLTDVCGPLHLMMATWSVSNDATHRFAEAMRRGWILSCRALLDWRVKVRRPDALAILRQAMASTDLRLGACHAKIYLLHNDDWHLTFVGSPNLTTNPRIEASVLTESKDVWRFHVDWLGAEIDGANPFDVPRRKAKKR
ncbi:hypothetical protein H8E07_10145 [bacterium]|nr:hypothetical protein [bacterium]